MGGSSWSSSLYDDRTAVRSARVKSGGAAFAYTHAVNTGAAPRAVNPAMDPKVVAGAKSPYVGNVMRESRDSADHPTSRAIGVFFDVTGSMHSIPVTLEKKLAGLMALLTRKGYVEHPQILFGAIGDATCDSVPLQVGQFESGVEMDDDLDKIFLEGGGGGTHSETYELTHYFFLKHTSTDCFEKRGQKGYLFTMGDEAPYDRIRKDHVKALIGDTIQADLLTKDVIEELQETWNVFHIIVEEGSYRNDKTIEGKWKALLGERVLKLEDQNNVAELIAMTIALTEGTVDIDAVDSAMTDAGLTKSTVKSVTSALIPYAKSFAIAKTGSVSGTLPAVPGSGGAERL